MLKPSEVLMRAHNEGRACGSCYIGDYALCALGFLIEPFKDEFDIEQWYSSHFVSEKYGVPMLVAEEIENRYEGWDLYQDNPQPLNVIAEWLEGIGY